MFHQNESGLDRLMRLVLGAALVVILFTTLTGLWQIIAGVVAAILLVTAATGFCPLYLLLRVNTRRASHAHPAAKS